MIKVWKFLSILIVAAVCLGLLLVPGITPQAAAAGTDWGFEIEPYMTGKGCNESFTVNATVVHYEGYADGFTMWLEFDPTYLEVTGVDTPATLPNGVAPFFPSPVSWDNTEGWVDVQISKAPGSDDINETFVYSTIHFLSKDVSGTSNLNFAVVNPSRQTTIILGGTDYLNWTKVVNGTVRIGSPTLTVNVTPAGMGNVTINAVTPPSYPNTTNWSWDDVVNLTAVVSVPNWMFTHWSGDLT